MFYFSLHLYDGTFFNSAGFLNPFYFSFHAHIHLSPPLLLPHLPHKLHSVCEELICLGGLFNLKKAFTPCTDICGLLPVNHTQTHAAPLPPTIFYTFTSLAPFVAFFFSCLPHGLFSHLFLLFSSFLSGRVREHNNPHLWLSSSDSPVLWRSRKKKFFTFYMESVRDSLYFGGSDSWMCCFYFFLLQYKQFLILFSSSVMGTFDSCCAFVAEHFRKIWQKIITQCFLCCTLKQILKKKKKK